MAMISNRNEDAADQVLLAFLAAQRDASALQLQSVPGRQGGQHVEVISACLSADLVDVAHVASFGQGTVMFVECGQRGLPVLAGSRPPQCRGRGAHRGGEEPAGRDIRRELGDHGLAGREVHQDSQQQHSVIDLAGGHRGEVHDRTGSQGDTILHLGPLGAQCGLEDGAHFRIGFDGEDSVAGAGQPDGLRSLDGYGRPRAGQLGRFLMVRAPEAMSSSVNTWTRWVCMTPAARCTAARDRSSGS
jgi:hypothetical protein